MRQTCLNMVHELARRDKRPLFIGSDLSPDLLKGMKEEMPDRWYMEGITEANVIGCLRDFASPMSCGSVVTPSAFCTSSTLGEGARNTTGARSRFVS